MATKLLLIQDVEDLGRSGDLVSVKPGYARNFLIPQQFAVAANKSALRMQARLQEERLTRALEDKKESEELASKLEGLTVTKAVKVDHDGHMYGSVTLTELLHLFDEQHGVKLEKKNIPLKHAIKEIGVFELVLKLKESVTANVVVKVVPEETHGQTVAK